MFYFRDIGCLFFHPGSRYILLLLLGFFHQPAFSQTEVVVAAEVWAPMIYFGKDGKPAGSVVEFIDQMNKVQDHYKFKFTIIPKLRLNQVFLEKRADVYPFRTTVWTKKELNLLPTKTIVSTGDVYIARKDNKYGGKAVFSDIPSKKIAGVLGYHYGIFNQNPDEKYIKRNFHAELLPSDEEVMKFILIGRAEVGIMSEILVGAFMQDQAIRNQLIVSNTADARVDLSNLVRADGPISVADMNAIISKMDSMGKIEKYKKIMHIGEFVH
ncbi:hypothetical protein CXB49_15645 [Chromobacterium sp. ATCC 53434]|uniref:substrate-binding periplasmic protein n=1 Tax=Chromobacterium sp. (strain ATCC 53434 / SC 14030) TaxID=2059672 RepID=UPI000C788F78|nr:transporter substrate-binding domain-containing protein [Chromobacterium sp. ATCC 53434]AUH52146.1 hypothetical protein CXB49_15645 [Chromobacterium sp. ATCC 53434]